MKRSDIVFSIIIPTYNRADRLVLAVESVLAQKFKNWELIIVDDGSTDGTREVVAKFADSRIHYFYKQNGERAIARNFGIKQANGEYITFLDSDDKLYPHCFLEAMDLISRSNNPEWIHLAYEIKDEKSNILRVENQRKGNINLSLVTGNHLSCIGVFVRNDILANHQFNEDPIIIGSEDYILWMRLAARYPLYYSNQISAFMIQHEDRSVMGFDLEKLEQRILRSIEIILSDEAFQEKYGAKTKVFLAHRYIYLALHSAMMKMSGLSLTYLIKSIFKHPYIIIERKFFAVLKTLIS